MVLIVMLDCPGGGGIAPMGVLPALGGGPRLAVFAQMRGFPAPMANALRVGDHILSRLA